MRYLCNLLLLLLLTRPAFSQPLPELIPYTDGKLWGYADTNGRLIIPPQWAGVELFKGNTAVVISGDSTPNASSNTYALINKKGTYIIPPSRNWRGTYSGWRGPLNARDAQGNWGMIDTLNRTEIPFTWQAATIKLDPDSLYKVVTKDGLMGVINRYNELIIPCRYNAVSSMPRINGVEIFLVADAQNPRLQGVIDANGKVRIPLGYNSIAYGVWPEGEGFLTRKEVRHEHTDKVTYEQSFISADGREEQKRKDANADHKKRYIRQGSYYLYGNNNRGYALLNARKKVLIPCCQVIAANKDTVFLYKAEYSGNRETVTRTYLNACSLKQLTAPEVLVYYREEVQSWPPQGTCVNGVRAWYAAKQGRDHLPEVNYKGRWGHRFFRDGLLWSVQEFCGNGPNYRSVHGWYNGYYADLVPAGIARRYLSSLAGEGDYVTVYSEPMYDSLGTLSGRQSHYAVVDHNARYVVPPLPDGYYIEGFNPHDGLVTARARGGNGALFNTKGILLSEIKGKEPRGAYSWENKIYTYVITSTVFQRDEDRIVEKIKLADDKGILIPSLSAYQVKSAMIRNGKTAALVLTDSLERMGIFSPGGENLYPAVNFKYRFLNVSADGMIFARDSLNRSGKLVDAHNRDLLSGMKPVHVSTATNRSVNISFRQDPAGQYKTIDGLYIATIPTNENPDKRASFYIDRNGRIYKAGLMTSAGEDNSRPGELK